MRVIGTAGHVDHGKSALVRALSGIDPDRLKEEKARGMTIDLGFAWVELRAAVDSGAANARELSESVGIIDVPGHIDFIKNMLAGVGGIDLALLVIAADEGVMPQTREHLAILDLLSVPAGVVALTKIDRAEDAEWLDLVEMDVLELLAATPFAGAPIVRVNSLSGEGVEQLRKVLAQQLAHLPPRRNRARPRLPVDRVFSLSGLGTIVTGTVSDGVFAAGDSVEILPARLPARIRGLQTHRQQVMTGEPGSRLAINLAGVGTEDLRRGDVVAHVNTLQPSTLIDVRCRLLAETPKALRHNQQVDFFCGAAETPAHARVLGVEQLGPGGEGFLQLRLARPVVVLPGDRFILRQPSPSLTIGGGVVLNPLPRRRWRRFDAAALANLQTLSDGGPDERLLQALVRRPLVSERELYKAGDMEAETAAASLARLRSEGVVKVLAPEGGEPLLLALDTWGALAEKLQGLLRGYHAQNPLRRGMARSEVRRRLAAWLPHGAQNGRAVNALLAALESSGAAAGDEQMVWLPGFAPKPTGRQQVAVDGLLRAYAAAPYAPPNWQDSMRILGDDTDLLAYLLEGGDLVRLGEDVLLGGGAFAEMVAAIRSHLQAQGSITLAEVRDRFGTSRKYAQAVLEEMDARRITRREGEGRVLR